nr:MAG TPA: hypothetical protein [Caudoviricetes sp.]
MFLDFKISICSWNSFAGFIFLNKKMASLGTHCEEVWEVLSYSNLPPTYACVN